MLKKKEIESLKNIGIEPFSDKNISFRFTISVNTKRLSFFEMFYNKFIKDSTIIGSNICRAKNVEESIIFYKSQVLVEDGKRIEFELKGPTKKYENILVEGVEYTRITFQFDNCHTLVVAKVITDLTDCINFISRIYGYDKDGNEILLIKYSIGTVVNIIGDSKCKDYVVCGYDYERDIDEFTYIIQRYEDGEVMSRTHIFESKIKPSRNHNLDILLGN